MVQDFKHAYWQEKDNRRDNWVLGLRIWGQNICEITIGF